MDFFEPPILLILGAGASADSGVPTVATFRERSAEVIDDPLLLFAIELWGEYYGNLNLEEAVTALRFHEQINVELPLFGRAARAKRLGLQWDKDLKPGELADLLEKAVPETIARTARLDKMTQYELLGEQLLEVAEKVETRWSHAVDVMSFNWDTLFEVSSEGKIELNQYWTQGRDARDKDRPVVSLFKPHGSLSYEVCLNVREKCHGHGRVAMVSDRRDWYESHSPLVGKCPSCNQVRDLLAFPPNSTRSYPQSTTRLHRQLPE